jgi:histidine ammonia-lyase
MTAMQALDYRQPHQSSPIIQDIRIRYRQVVPRLEADRILSTDLEKTVRFLRTLQIAE